MICEEQPRPAVREESVRKEAGPPVKAKHRGLLTATIFLKTIKEHRLVLQVLLYNATSID